MDEFSDGAVHKYVIDDAAKRQVNRFCISKFTIATYVHPYGIWIQRTTFVLKSKELLNRTAEDWNDYSACLNPLMAVINVN
jgi:hypothetical protein